MHGSGTTEGKDILDTFTKNFKERGIDIKVFSVTIDGAPAMMRQHERLELACI